MWRAEMGVVLPLHGSTLANQPKAGRANQRQVEDGRAFLKAPARYLAFRILFTSAS